MIHPLWETRYSKSVILSRANPRIIVCTEVRQAFLEFHSAIMGGKIEKLDELMEKNRNGSLSVFQGAIERDIIPIRNAIIHKFNSRFIEGNNTKFKHCRSWEYALAATTQTNRERKAQGQPCAFRCQRCTFLFVLPVDSASPTRHFWPLKAMPSFLIKGYPSATSSA